MIGLGRTSREQAEFDKLHYPGTETLRNRLGLRDRAKLDLSERYLSAKRARQGLPQAARSIDVSGLKARC